MPSAPNAQGNPGYSLLFKGGFVQPFTARSTGIERTLQAGLGLLHDLGNRSTIGVELDYLAWNEQTSPVSPAKAVSDVWRGVGSLRFDVVQRSEMIPFVYAEGGVTRFQWSDRRVATDDVTGEILREGVQIAPSFGAGVGIVSSKKMVRFSVRAQWVGSLDSDLPDSISLLGGIEISDASANNMTSGGCSSR